MLNPLNTDLNDPMLCVNCHFCADVGDSLVDSDSLTRFVYSYLVLVVRLTLHLVMLMSCYDHASEIF